MSLGGESQVQWRGLRQPLTTGIHKHTSGIEAKAPCGLQTYMYLITSKPQRSGGSLEAPPTPQHPLPPTVTVIPISYQSRSLLQARKSLSFATSTMSTHCAGLGVDMSQPASSILKTGTAKIHEEVEESLGASHLSNGELSREEYIRCLMVFWHIYRCVSLSTLGAF